MTVKTKSRKLALNHCVLMDQRELSKCLCIALNVSFTITSLFSII